MSIAFGYAYDIGVAACPSYQNRLHTRRVPDKAKSITLIGCGGKEGICGCWVAGRWRQSALGKSLIKDRILGSAVRTSCGEHSENCSCRTYPRFFFFLLFVVCQPRTDPYLVQQVHGLGTRLPCKSAVVSATTATTVLFFLHSIRLAVQRRSRIYPWWKFSFIIHNEKCPRLGYYAASSDNFLPTFRDKLSPHLQASINPYYAPYSSNSLPTFRDIFKRQ